MTRCLVDTSVLVDLSKQVQPTRSLLTQMAVSGDELCVCPVVVTEFFTGIALDAIPEWETFFETFRFLPITDDIARAAAMIRRESRRIGRPIATPDALIAAVASAWGATLLTENPRHFSLPGLVVRSLRG